MACVLGDRDKGHNAGWLFLSPVTSPEDCWLDGLDYPASDVIQLSFPTEEDVYIVLRPHVSARGREYGIRIIHLSLHAKRMNTLVIESRVSASFSLGGGKKKTKYSLANSVNRALTVAAP